MGEAVSPVESFLKEPEVVLEGALLKQGRSRRWNERYFVFTSNQVLSYYHRKGDSQPRGSFRITREAGCEISDLYVEQRQRGTTKEALYCVNISVADDVYNNASFQQLMHESFVRRDDASILGGCNPQLEQQLQSQTQLPAGSQATAGKGNIISASGGGSGTPPPPRNRKGFSKAVEEHLEDNISRPKSPPYLDLHLRKSSASPLLDPHSRKSIAASYSGDNSLASEGSAKHVRRSKGWFGRSINNQTHQQSAAISEVPGIIGMELDDSLPGYETLLDSSEPPSAGGLGSSHHNNLAIRVEDSKTIERMPSLNLSQIERPDRPSRQDSKGRQSTPSTPRKKEVARTSSNSKLGMVSSPYDEKNAAELDKLHTTYVSTMLQKKKKARKQVIEGTKFAAAATAAIGVGVMTAGVGIAAGLIVLGATAAAGGTAGVAEAGFKRRKASSTKLTFASTNFEEVKLWKSSLEACLDFESVAHSTWGQLFMADGRKTRSALLPRDVDLLTKNSHDGAASSGDDGFLPRNFLPHDLPESQNNLFLKNRAFLVEANTRWRPLEGGWTSLLGSGGQGLRIFREEIERSNLAVGGTTCAPLKAQVVLNAHPLDAFMCLMSFARIIPSDLPSDGKLVPNSGQRSSFRLLENIDDHTDVVHLVCQQLYLFPSWTAPRDFVLFRYWRYEPDGSYIVCLESVEHSACPPRPDFVRGEMHQVCTLAPTKNLGKSRSGMVSSSATPECLLTSVVQVDPKGWVPTKPLAFLSNQGYADAFGVAGLLQLLDVRDAIDHDRFLNVAADTQYIPHNPHKYGQSSNDAMGNRGRGAPEHLNYDFEFANRERLDSVNFDSVSGIESNPEPLDAEKWAEPDANSFLVRGSSYKRDRVKVNAGTSIGRLIAVDVVLVDKPIYSGMSTHPTERIQLALKREKKRLANGKSSDMPPFIFVVNIVLPGPPFYHGVFYYAVDDFSTIDGSDGTGSSLLCKEFLFGESDSFRDRTFKLIPQIVQGNFMVRKAVGSTPAIMGTKLKQNYVRHKRFCEIILDCGSSPVAMGVIRLSLGYAKTLAIDMGFLLEGDDESTLPERIFGCVRMKFPEFGPHLRKVEAPPESDDGASDYL